MVSPLMCRQLVSVKVEEDDRLGGVDAVEWEAALSIEDGI